MIDINKEIVENLSKTELDIVRFINENEEQLQNLSIVDIAIKTYTSIASVSRAIRKCWINGFQELRYQTLKNTQKNDVREMTTVINKSLIEAQEAIDRISVSELLHTVRLINGAEKIYVFARGLSEYVAEEFTLKLQLLGCNVIFYRDPNIIRISAKKMTTKELLIIFSLNGRTPELIEASQSASICGTPIVLCCCDFNTEIGNYATCKLIGYQHLDHTIKNYEVASRLPLQIVSRLITDYMVYYKLL